MTNKTIRQKRRQNERATRVMMWEGVKGKTYSRRNKGRKCIKEV